MSNATEQADAMGIWSSVLVTTLISTFLAMSTATQIDHKSSLVNEDIIQAVIVVISYALMIYFLSNPGVILTDISWWAMGLIGLLPILGIFLGITVVSFDLPDLTSVLKLSKSEDDRYFPDFKKFGKFFKEKWMHDFDQMIGDSNDLTEEFKKINPTLNELDSEYQYWESHYSKYYNLRSTLRDYKNNRKISKKEAVALQGTFSKLDGAPFFLLNDEIIEMLEWVKSELSNTYDSSSDIYLTRVKKIQDFQSQIQNYKWK